MPLQVTVWPFAIPKKPSAWHTEWFFASNVERWYDIERFTDHLLGEDPKLSSQLAHLRGPRLTPTQRRPRLCALPRANASSSSQLMASRSSVSSLEVNTRKLCQMKKQTILLYVVAGDLGSVHVSEMNAILGFVALQERLSRSASGTMWIASVISSSSYRSIPLNNVR